MALTTTPAIIITAPTVLTHGPDPTRNRAMSGARLTAPAMPPTITAASTVMATRARRTHVVAGRTQAAIAPTTRSNGTSGHSRRVQATPPLSEKPKRSTSSKIS